MAQTTTPRMKKENTYVEDVLDKWAKMFLSSLTNKKKTITAWELFVGEVLDNDELGYDEDTD